MIFIILCGNKALKIAGGCPISAYFPSKYSLLCVCL